MDLKTRIVCRVCGQVVWEEDGFSFEYVTAEQAILAHTVMTGHTDYGRELVSRGGKSEEV